MSWGRAAILSRRRSSLRRCPSGEAQYFAGESHPEMPACFLFLRYISSPTCVDFHHRQTRLFFFPDIPRKRLSEYTGEDRTIAQHEFRYRKKHPAERAWRTLATDTAQVSGHRVGAERNTAVQNAPNSPLECAAVGATSRSRMRRPTHFVGPCVPTVLSIALVDERTYYELP